MPMEQQWINYPIFVSSTFCDMDQERDAIKFHVIPRLNDLYRQRFVQFQAIDLRVGINTEDMASEEARESHILDICLKKIEQSRPFFIGLLGKRYGWVPSEQRWHSIYETLDSSQRPLLEQGSGCSVTELEILYGAIGNDGQHLDHSVFMERSDETYDSIPIAKKGVYQDQYNDNLSPQQKEEHLIKIANLRGRINDATLKKHKTGAIPYTLKWDKEHNRFTDFGSFETQLFDKLCLEINSQLETVSQGYFTWQGQDRANAEALANRLVKESATTSIIYETLELIGQGHHQLLITGDVGCGKSTVAAFCYDYLNKHGYTCCIAWVGFSTHSLQMRYILIRWIQQLIDDAPECSEEALLKASENNDVKLYKMLKEAVAQAQATGEKVCFILDGIEQLQDYHENELYQMWIDDEMTVILTAHESVAAHVGKYHKALHTVKMGYPSPADMRLMIERCEESSNLQLPNAIKEDLVKRELMPIQLKLIMLLFTQLSSDHYESMRQMQAADNMARINQYFIQLYENAPQDLPRLVNYVIRELISRLSLPACYENIFIWIAASQQGLRQNEIAHLMGEDWDMLSFHFLAELLSDILSIDSFSQHWKIRSKFIRQALMPHDATPFYRQMAQCLLALPDDDPLKQDILVYCLIEAEDPLSGMDYIGSVEHYDYSREEILRWSRLSSNLLLSDPDYLDHLVALSARMQPAQVIWLARMLVRYAIDYHIKTLERQAIGKALLLPIDIHQLDARSSFLLGDTLLQSSSLYFTENGQTIIRYDEDFIKAAYRALERSVELKPDNEEYKSMFMAAGFHLSEIAIQQGDFDLASEIMDKVNGLQ